MTLLHLLACMTRVHTAACAWWRRHRRLPCQARPFLAGCAALHSSPQDRECPHSAAHSHCSGCLVPAPPRLLSLCCAWAGPQAAGCTARPAQLPHWSGPSDVLPHSSLRDPAVKSLLLACRQSHPCRPDYHSSDSYTLCVIIVQVLSAIAQRERMHSSAKTTRKADAISDIPVKAFCNGDPRRAGKDNPQLHQERHSSWMLLARHSVRLSHCLLRPLGCHLGTPKVLRKGRMPEQACMTRPQGRLFRQ